jgi:hypothetical protein
MKREMEKTVQVIEKKHHKEVKKTSSRIIPDIDKTQVVVIDNRTKLYITAGASAEEARKRYFDNLRIKRHSK